MTAKRVALAAIGIGVFVLMSQWGQVTEWASRAQVDSWVLLPDEVTNWPAFAQGIVAAGRSGRPSPGRRIWQVLTPDARTALARLAEAPKDEQVARDLAQRATGALNEVLEMRGLYRPRDFQEVSLPDEVRRLVAADPRELADVIVRKRNRLLLEAAYPDQIAPTRAVRTRRVVYWTSSGSPQVDLAQARDFMQQYKDTWVLPNFRETGGLEDIVFVSFLSGNPPDYIKVKLPMMREFVIAGMIRPMDDLIRRQLDRDPKFLANRVDGEEAMIYFQANPNDRFIREMEKYPQEAARLLSMHGKFVGFRSTRGFQTLTYNKRIFREAARLFPHAGLVDEQGEPVPPTTWAEFYEKARIIREYGRRTGSGTYGLVIQGQRAHDIMRGIKPLAATAGSRGFNHKGKTWVPGEPTLAAGFYEYEHPGFLAAFKLILKLKAADCILPGTESRHYEDVRTELAMGNAGMLIDGWHAALIGAERVPWAAKQLGSAPIPVPWIEPGEDDPPQARARFRQDRRKLREILGPLADRIVLGRAYRGGEDSTDCITSLAESPWRVWQWMMRGSDPAVEKKNMQRGALPGTFAAAEKITDPNWAPYPYQRQAWRILMEDSWTWPDAPVHSPVQVDSNEEVFYKLYFKGDLGDIDGVVAQAQREVSAFSAACNRDLARRIQTGEAEPRLWTFPDWDPRYPERFYNRQRKATGDPELERQLSSARERLQRLRPGALDRVTYEFKPSESSWQVLWVPAMLLGVVGLFLAWRVVCGGRRGRTGVGDTLRLVRAQRHAYVFVLPAMLALFAFVIYPSFYQIYLAFHSGSGIGPLRPVGTGNFQRMTADANFWGKALPNTGIYMVTVTSARIVIAMFLANLLALPLRANRVYRVLFFVPLVTSLAVVSVVFLGLLAGPKSGMNQLLESIGLEKLPYWMGLVDGPKQKLDWLGDPKTDLACVMAVGIWHGLPYTIILLLAGLQSISPDLYEAAKVDGAGAWKRFWHVTIPELTPILIVIIFNSLVGAARAFGVVYVLTEGGKDHSSELVATYIFKQGFTRPENQSPDVGYASALGIAYAVILAVLTFANVWIIAQRWRRRMRTEAAAGRSANA
jgi:ABC-type sugar transport system permease subunit